VTLKGERRASKKHACIPLPSLFTPSLLHPSPSPIKQTARHGSPPCLFVSCGRQVPEPPNGQGDSVHWRTAVLGVLVKEDELIWRIARQGSIPNCLKHGLPVGLERDLR
jgi:hypothetical protein